MRELSTEFSREIKRDSVKRCLLPAKSLLEVLLVWPGTISKYILVANWLIFASIMVTEVFHFAYIIVHKSDIVDSLLTSITVTTTTEALVRVYVIVQKKQVLNDILYAIWKDFWSLESMSDKAARKLSRRCYAIIGLNVGCFISAILCNFIVTLRPYLMGNLIFNSVYPFNWNQTYVYEIVYIWQYFEQWYMLLVVNVFDSLLITIAGICIVQFIILQKILKNILIKRSRAHRKILFGKIIPTGDAIKRCLTQQLILLEICGKLESMLSIPMLVQMVNSTAAICASCVVLKVKPEQFYKMLTFAIAHMFQLLSYCYVGSNLSYQSSNIADAMYSCNWQSSDDMEFKKALIFMIQVSQKAPVFTAGSMMAVDLVTYVKVLRLSLSFYTLFNSVIDRKNGNGTQDTI